MSDATSNVTGYFITVKKNYESYAQKLKDRAKENVGEVKDNANKKNGKIHKKHMFTYSFALMDLKTRLYISMGSSIKSEREAYDKAMNFLASTFIEMDLIRPGR